MARSPESLPGVGLTGQQTESVAKVQSQSRTVHVLGKVSSGGIGGWRRHSRRPDSKSDIPSRIVGDPQDVSVSAEPDRATFVAVEDFMIGHDLVCFLS